MTPLAVRRPQRSISPPISATSSPSIVLAGDAVLEGARTARVVAALPPIEQNSSDGIGRVEQALLLDRFLQLAGDDAGLDDGDPSSGSIGWIDVNTWDKTHDAEASQGWCPAVLDTNNDGKITQGWTEPDQAVDPDQRPSHRFRLLLGGGQPQGRQPVVLGHRTRCEAADAA